MLSMAAEIRRRGQTFDMIVCVRNKSSLPFSGYLHKLADTNHVKIFYTDESMPDIAAMFSEVQERRHIYTCGPKKFMELVADSTKHWPKSQVHFESFSPVTALEGDVALLWKQKPAERLSTWQLISPFCRLFAKTELKSIPYVRTGPAARARSSIWKVSPNIGTLC
jgi:ferredoxin-NADP reductase